MSKGVAEEGVFEEDPNKFYINTRKLYKIWFSNDRDKFLNDENKLRFVKFRVDNPESEISFVYSGRLLNDNAVTELQKFCKKHTIIPVDLDKVSIESARDQVFHDLINKELDKWITNEGGNPAAASDMARLHKPIIERCGIYSDFDVELLFKDLPERYQRTSPIAVSFTVVEYKVNRFNNEAIIFATKSDGSLHEKSIEVLNLLQQSIKEMYNQASNRIMSSLTYDVISMPLLMIIKEIIWIAMEIKLLQK